uniref:Uncharacterized protein n=1 Tax=Phenylobacterium glaciei TaxID=2803784 RepID=A0A974P294_9CAUL|nr:hypothetical protein JKL49_24960 [Phenylobacterium glaciei]
MRDRAGLTVVSAPTHLPLVRCVGFVTEGLTEPGGAAGLASLFIGLEPRLDLAGLGFLRLPQRLRPSPLNLIYRRLGLRRPPASIRCGRPSASSTSIPTDHGARPHPGPLRRRVLRHPADRAGGGRAMVPLHRRLRDAGGVGTPLGRIRAYLAGLGVPPEQVIHVGAGSGAVDGQVHRHLPTCCRD